MQRTAFSSQRPALSAPSGLPFRPILSIPQHRAVAARVQQDATLSSQRSDVIIVSRYEESRKYWRTVYDFPQWEKHRDSNRFVRRLFTIPTSHILTNISPSLALTTTISTALVAYMLALDQGLLPEGAPSLQVNNACSAFVNNTSVALSLLLVFRTNSSYGRWDEARKMWGGLLNRSRDIMRQGATLFPTEDLAARQALARWMVAFARALRIHFQPEVTLESELGGILTPRELEYLKAAPHRPVRAIHALGQVIQNVDMSPIHQMQMSQELTFFHDVLGGCERLLRAPIPLSYTRHTARFLVLWLSLLPFSLYGSLGPWTIPVVLATTAVLAGIKEIGVQCEEPFGILPLDVICNRIQLDVMSTLKDDLDEQSKAGVRQVIMESMGLLPDGARLDDELQAAALPLPSAPVVAP
ncbi:Bestrophin, RFP-TM, chloride channel-domain-containing protein [Haematococcus lacustris]